MKNPKPLMAKVFAVLTSALPIQAQTYSALGQAEKPNIVFIMADDLGWADVGYNGAEFYETPHIDALCQSGMKFTMAYPGAANCLPSRSCIMSGMYTARTKMWQPGKVAKGEPKLMRFLVPNQSNKKGDGNIATTTSLDPSMMSLAEMLKQVGYKTLHLGKWQPPFSPMYDAKPRFPRPFRQKQIPSNQPTTTAISRSTTPRSQIIQAAMTAAVSSTKGLAR